MATKLPPRLSDERRLFIEPLLATCTPETIIKKRIREKFGVGAQTAKRWIETTLGILADEARPRTRDERRSQMRIVLSDFYQKALLARQFNAAVVALDRLCKLDGLYRPDEIAVTAAGVDRDPDRVRERIRTLLERTGLGTPTDEQVSGLADAAAPPPPGPTDEEVN